MVLAAVSIAASNAAALALPVRLLSNVGRMTSAWADPASPAKASKPTDTAGNRANR